MPLFGKKKNEEAGQGGDIEAAEEDGLLMSTRGAAPAAEHEAAPEPEAEMPAAGPSDETADGMSAEAAPDGEVRDGESAEGEEDDDPASFAAKAESEEETGDDDLLSMFKDDESHGELAELTKDLDDVPIADLLAELREIRSTLPPDVAGDESAAA